MKFKIKKVSATYRTGFDRKGEPYRYRNKLYIWPEKESVLDNLFNRHNRPSRVWKEEVIPAIIIKLKEEKPEIYRFVMDEKWGWRQKCGCSCPCSPGFVGKSSHGFDISVEVEFLAD